MWEKSKRGEREEMGKQCSDPSSTPVTGKDSLKNNKNMRPLLCVCNSGRWSEGRRMRWEGAW